MSARSALSCLVLASIGAAPAAARGNGTDFDDVELQLVYEKYALPYGVLGAISHVVLLYILGCHMNGVRPLMPWRPLEYHLTNVVLTFITSIITIALAAISISKVHESPALTALLVLQIIFGIVLDAVSVHRYAAHKHDPGLLPGTAFWLVILCCVAFAASQVVGQMERTRRLWGRWTDPLMYVLGFLAIGGGLLAVLSVFCLCRGRSGEGKRRESRGMHFFVITALISSLGWFVIGDYGVALLTGQTLGLPGDKTRTLYWVYYVFQYVPLGTF
ncbi:hypothetical protein GGTG_02432 [Gaeumannomyces tritici R3-111a-1]|uniref:Integral membrane protein n=1 Tax=Gaeumannomyces tritici (strain R3-111a-1) TaxID=644352 RepID=J3NMC8_GAET3|nr:hypothetical protein GGTG_02432 [Gaeumannomyces tritici R3-111a-1]EJT82459.1 hypothetical protein GGTG_02432 [Gaeumannomyces tritici R3-111a-1]